MRPHPCVTLRYPRRGRMIANPGSVGLPAFDDHELVPAHMGPVIPQACYLIAELNAEGWQVTLQTVAYDIERAARRNQWPAWLGLYAQDRKAPAMIYTRTFRIYKKY